MTKVSILNLIPKYKDETQKDSVDRAVRLAKFADQRDFSRYWIAEHHNSPAVLGAATDIMICHMLHNTNRITVGAGGVMLPNHTPFQVVERYASLDILFPGRVDIGIGRAPGTDIETAKLIYRNIYRREDFTKAIEEMQLYMSDEAWDLKVAPYPGAGSKIPITILGSSETSAHIAAELGLPYSFAGHFAPHTIGYALDIYRSEFKPSKYLERPYVMLGTSVNIAKTKSEAEILKEHAKNISLQIIRQERKEFLKLDPDNEPELTSMEKFVLRTSKGLSIEGDIDEARSIWKQIKEEYNPDEVIGASYIPEEDKLIDNYKFFEDIILNSWLKAKSVD